MRFIHTADWQVGMRAVHVGAAASRVREARFAAAERVVAAARARGAEFIVLAGDTFEDNAVDRRLVQRVADLLAAFGGPVYLLPGNHDPLVPGSVWEHGSWAENANLHVLLTAEPVPVSGGTLFPCPCFERHSSKDPAACITGASGEGVRLGLAHGSVVGLPDEDLDRPIARDGAARAGLDYLALGHWHSTAIYDDGGVARMGYSGTHETTAFGERASGNVLLVEVDAPGAPPRVEAIHIGGLRWVSMERVLREDGDVSRLRAEVDGLAEPASTLIDLRLTGLLGAGDRAELVRLREVAETRFLFARLDESGLRPRPEDASWLADLPEGLVRTSAQRLLELTDPNFAGTRAEGATPEVAYGALLELYALLREGER